MDIETLREFTTLVSCGSYTAAAKALYMSQPSLSRHIAMLEKEVGQKLFFDSHPLVLTKAGEIVMEHAADILSSHETMSIRISSLPHVKPELIRIQNLMHFEALYTGVLEAASQTEAAFPNVSFEYSDSANSFTSSDALLSNEADAVFQFNITSKPYATASFPPETFRCIPIANFTGELGLGIRRDSPLLEKGELWLSDFASKRFLVIAKRSTAAFVDDFRNICRAEGFSPRIELVAKDDIFDFYSRDPKEGVLFITCMSKDRHTTFDRYIDKNMIVIRPKSKNGPYFVSPTLIALKRAQSKAFAFFLDRLEEIERERRKSDEISGCAS